MTKQTSKTSDGGELYKVGKRTYRELLDGIPDKSLIWDKMACRYLTNQEVADMLNTRPTTTTEGEGETYYHKYKRDDDNSHICRRSDDGYVTAKELVDLLNNQPPPPVEASRQEVAGDVDELLDDLIKAAYKEEKEFMRPEEGKLPEAELQLDIAKHKIKSIIQGKEKDTQEIFNDYQDLGKEYAKANQEIERLEKQLEETMGQYTSEAANYYSLEQQYDALKDELAEVKEELKQVREANER